MKPEEHFSKAAEICQATWPNSFFTPLIMLQWLLNKCQRTFEDFVKTPNFDAERELLKNAIQDANEEELRPLWANGTGVCTSWAVYIASALGEENGTVYSFGDKWNHRAAWSQDGVAIDSSARNALQLTDGKIKGAYNTKLMMKHVGTSDAILCSVSSRMILTLS
jgi:hypothetical protein